MGITASAGGRGSDLVATGCDRRVIDWWGGPAARPEDEAPEDPLLDLLRGDKAVAEEKFVALAARHGARLAEGAQYRNSDTPVPLTRPWTGSPPQAGCPQGAYPGRSTDPWRIACARCGHPRHVSVHAVGLRPRCRACPAAAVVPATAVAGPDLLVAAAHIPELANPRAA